jgi:hypothetical protein
MIGNGNGHSNGHADLGELRERLHWSERALAAVDDGDDPELRQDWQHRRDAARGALAAAEFSAQAEREGLRRSQMPPRAVSRFIRSHPGGPAAGAAAFRELPR